MEIQEGPRLVQEELLRVMAGQVLVAGRALPGQVALDPGSHFIMPCIALARLALARLTATAEKRQEMVAAA